MLFRSLPGYTFYTTEHPDHPGKPLGWPQPDETEKAYWKEVWSLADAMASQLKRMEWAAGRTSVSAAAQGKAEIVPTRVGRTLFLGYMHDSLHELRSSSPFATRRGLAALTQARQIGSREPVRGSRMLGTLFG